MYYILCFKFLLSIIDILDYDNHSKYNESDTFFYILYKLIILKHSNYIYIYIFVVQVHVGTVDRQQRILKYLDRSKILVLLERQILNISPTFVQNGQTIAIQDYSLRFT